MGAQGRPWAHGDTHGCQGWGSGLTAFEWSELENIATRYAATLLFAIATADTVALSAGKHHPRQEVINVVKRKGFDTF